MFAYCNNNPIMYVDPEGEFFVALFALCGIAALLTVTLSSCEEADTDISSTPMDPSPKTKKYDNYNDAVSDAVKYVSQNTANDNWQYEYNVTVYSYENYYYIGMYGTGKGEVQHSYTYNPSSGTIEAIIHSHPYYQQEPFKEDWNTYRDVYGKNIESYIIDNYNGNIIVRYLPKNARDNTAWKIWEG